MTVAFSPIKNYKISNQQNDDVEEENDFDNETDR